MFWVGFLAVGFLLFILITIYSSLYMAKRTDEAANRPSFLMMESSEELMPQQERIEEERL